MYQTTYNTDEFGQMLQNSNPNQIVVISWDTEHSDLGPDFHFFLNLQNVIDYLYQHYQTPFIISDNSWGFTKTNAILVYNDDRLIINVIGYKSEATVFKFFNSANYQKIKNLLSNDAIPMKEFQKSQLDF